MKLFKRIAILLILVLLIGAGGAWWLYDELERTPGELIRHAEMRLVGHTRLESLLTPGLQWAKSQIERKVESVPPPMAMRGVRPAGLPPQQYDPLGMPIEAGANTLHETAPAPTHLVRDVASLEKAFESAREGDVIELLPGTYIVDRRLRTANPGAPGNPITVRAGTVGSVRIESRSLQAFVVTEPHWLFENLHLVGSCDTHDQCEHAFQVTGGAIGFVLRNSIIQDFNAALKVNGTNGDYPDFGLVQHNLIFNTAARRTSLPVTPIDIVAADEWQVLDNHIADFSRANGPAASYGIFMKGGGRGGRIARNLIVCQSQVHTPNGIQVGLSFGGGTTDRGSMRQPAPDYEHTEGVAANNVVAHCNDFGIDVNSSTNIHVAFNTLINTYGIDVRVSPATAAVYGNFVEGAIRARRGGYIEAQANMQGRAAQHFADPDHLRLGWTSPPPRIARLASIEDDLCRAARNEQTLPGAFSEAFGCDLEQTVPTTILGQ